MNTLIPEINFHVIMPQVILSCVALLVLLMGLVISRKNQIYLAIISLLGILACLLFNLNQFSGNNSTFSYMAVMDGTSMVFNILFLVSTALIIVLSIPFLENENTIHAGEYYSLILFATVGMILMATTLDLIILFLGLELMSISLYILASITRHDSRSNEAAMKYLLLGAFATAFLLYGIAFIYGATGSTNIMEILEFFSERSPQPNQWMLTVGLGLLIVGFGFKIGLVPFHAWIPDVYEGAPTVITAFMSIGPKAAGFVGLIRVFMSGPFLSSGIEWAALLAVLAGLTMTIGNVIAIAQNNLKRMLAYSSIAHAGYILVGLVSATPQSTRTILFYFFAYLFMNLGAFTVLFTVQDKSGNGLTLRDYSGLGYKYPSLALAMTFFMISLSGFPPTAGFMGKFFIFKEAVDAGYIGLVIIAVLNSVVSAYYYLRVVVFMYMREPEKERSITVPALTAVILFICILGIFYMGILPNRVLQLTYLTFYF